MFSKNVFRVTASHLHRHFYLLTFPGCLAPEPQIPNQEHTSPGAGSPFLHF